MKYSLRHFLLLSILLTILIMAGVTIWGSYRASINEVEELFDAQLSRSARLILGLALAQENLGSMADFYESIEQNRPLLLDKKHIEEEIYQQGHLYELKLAYQVWDSYGNLLLRSANAPLQPITVAQQGYDNKRFNDQNWRTYSLWDSNHYFEVITAEREDVRDDLVRQITRQMTWPFVLLVPLMAGVVWYFIGHGLKPLEQVAAELARRETDQLEPLEVSRVPSEIQPLVAELNRLFASLKQAFEKEKAFTSDAAHELRTPLAALKTHLQVLQSGRRESDRETAIQAIGKGVDRASHLVEQLLGLARLDPEAIRATQKLEYIDLQALCAEAIAEIYPLANERQQTISLNAEDGIMLWGYRYPLECMLHNLLGNSITYTPEQGEIQLELQEIEGRLDIRLHDSGPGIPEEQREAVLRRFSKVRGQSYQQGSGIGLSIVRRVAELHHMQLKLEQSGVLGGLCVHLWLNPGDRLRAHSHLN